MINNLCLSCGGDIIPLAAEISGKALGECEVCGMLHTLTKDAEGNMDADQNIAAKELTPERKELLEKLRSLQTRYNEVSDIKKAMNKDYSDQLKDLSSEIKDTLTALEG